MNRRLRISTEFVIDTIPSGNDELLFHIQMYKIWYNRSRTSEADEFQVFFTAKPNTYTFHRLFWSFEAHRSHRSFKCYRSTTNKEDFCLHNILGKVSKLYTCDQFRQINFLTLLQIFVLTDFFSYPFPKVMLVDIINFCQSNSPSSKHDLILVTKKNAYATKRSPFPLELHREKN